MGHRLKIIVRCLSKIQIYLGVLYLCPKCFMGWTYTENYSVVYRKSKFNWVSYIFYLARQPCTHIQAQRRQTCFCLLQPYSLKQKIALRKSPNVSGWHARTSQSASALFFLLFRTAAEAYESSQARDWIGATAAGLHHRHSNVGSKPHLWSIPQLRAMLDP